jgi:hypothetical protein
MYREAILLAAVALAACGGHDPQSDSGSGGDATSASNGPSSSHPATSVAVATTGAGGGMVDPTCDPAPTPGTFWAQNADLFGGGPTSMCHYHGDVVLVVNVAEL